MAPTEQGGVILETGQEVGSAINTLTIAMMGNDANNSTPEEQYDFMELGRNIADAPEDEPVILDSAELRTLTRACEVAKLDAQFAMGMVLCFQILTQEPDTEVARQVMDASGVAELQMASVIAGIGAAPVHLSGLFELYLPK